MLPAKIRAPVHIDIRRFLGTATHQNQLLLHQLFHLHAGPVIRLMNQGGVQHALLQFFMQGGALADFGAHRNVRTGFAQSGQPVQQPRIPEADFAPQGEHLAGALRQRQCTPGRVPGTNQLAGVDGELLPIGGQAGTTAVSHEQPAAELPLQVVNARGHGGLGNVQTFAGGHEAAGADDLQKGASQFDIHA